jgi:hypothetical protein
MNDLIEPLIGVDWNDVDGVACAAAPVLENLSTDPSLLREHLKKIRSQKELFALSEHHPGVFDKVVLHDDASGIRVRVHIFLDGYTDAPHDHRWTFASRIVRNSYRHRMYGAVDLETVAADDLNPIHIRTEKEGDTYVLHHTMVHALEAEPDTVSIIVRGPAVKSRFMVRDLSNRAPVIRVGAADEQPRQAASKRMTRDRFEQVVERLGEWKVI